MASTVRLVPTTNTHSMHSCCRNIPRWFTRNNNDSELLKSFHLDPKRERQIRKSHNKLDHQPKILIVTEKLLTGFDAPLLYAMYLDKPMRDHTLLQAIARVNRPYENEQEALVKPHGFVLDFVGLFDNLEKALAFDSEEIQSVVKDLKLLKTLFQSKMAQKVPEYLKLITQNFDDRDVESLIEHFRDPERRKAFFKEYKEIQVDRAFQKKTCALVQKHVGTSYIQPVNEVQVINEDTLRYIADSKGGERKKIINLVKSIAKKAEEESDDPYLIAMAARAQAVQEGFENRQTSTAEALEKLLKEVKDNETRKKEQAEKGFDGLTYFVYRTLLDAKIADAEETSRKIKAAFVAFPNWKKSENALRELRKKVTFAIYAGTFDLDQVTTIVDELFTLLEKANRI